MEGDFGLDARMRQGWCDCFERLLETALPVVEPRCSVGQLPFVGVCRPQLGQHLLCSVQLGAGVDQGPRQLATQIEAVRKNARQGNRRVYTVPNE